MGCRRWGKAEPILRGGELCQEEMAQAPMGKVREPAGDWDGAGVWDGWEETALGQVPVEIAYVLVVGQAFLTRQAFPAMT